MHTLYLVSVWLHIVASMTWIGGMLFLVLVLVPLLRQPDMRDRALQMFHVLGLRFRRVGWLAIITIVITGVLNLLGRGFRLEQVLSGEVFTGVWGHTLAIKLALVTLIVVTSLVHDFHVGPTATRLGREGAAPERRERLRRFASWMGRMTLLAALAVVALAVTLVRGAP